MRDAPRRVVVTGAAGGSGGAAVAAFARAGATVAAITHRTPLPSSLHDAGSVLEYRCDVGDPEAMREALEQIATDIGGMDALIHTAAVDRLVTATIGCNRAAFEHLRDSGGGSVVNVHGPSAVPAEVGQWMHAAALEWRMHQVRVNAIAPVTLTTAEEYRDPYEDLAPVLRFLAGDDSRSITGQTLSVDGSWVRLRV